MNKVLKILLLTFVAVVSVSAQSNKDEKKAKQPTDRKVILEQVSKLNMEYSFMIQRGDAAEIERVLADDYLLTDEEGKVFTKAEDLATYKTRQSTVKIESVKYLGQKVRVVGDVVVIANATINFKGTRNDKPFDITEQCTTIWAWRDGHWQIVSDHFSYVKK
jgi:ketosteroid isomerase-like protein